MFQRASLRWDSSARPTYILLDQASALIKSQQTPVGTNPPRALLAIDAPTSTASGANADQGVGTQPGTESPLLRNQPMRDAFRTLPPPRTSRFVPLLCSSSLHRVAILSRATPRDSRAPGQTSARAQRKCPHRPRPRPCHRAVVGGTGGSHFGSKYRQFLLGTVTFTYSTRPSLTAGLVVLWSLL